MINKNIHQHNLTNTTLELTSFQMSAKSFDTIATGHLHPAWQ